MKYFATAKHHSQISYWEKLAAGDLRQAKREASALFGGDLHGSYIHVVEVADVADEERLNDLPACTKLIASYQTGWENP